MLCCPGVADARTEAIAGREDVVSCLFRTSYKFLYRPEAYPSADEPTEVSDASFGGG